MMNVDIINKTKTGEKQMLNLNQKLQNAGLKQFKVKFNPDTEIFTVLWDGEKEFTTDDEDEIRVYVNRLIKQEKGSQMKYSDMNVCK